MAGGKPHAVIVGGSLAGLIAGNLLCRIGWDVDIFERTDGVLEGRGAGITVLPGLVEGLQAAGVNITEAALGVNIPMRIALDRAGEIVAERSFPQVMTSWRRLFDLLKSVFPEQRYHSGVVVERIEQTADQVSAHLTGGERVHADLLIGADGLRSTVRGQYLPELKPYYPGYIAWRCLANESELPAASHAAMFDRYAVCVAPGEQGIAYPVPGPEHRWDPGRRQFNVVWYHPVREADELPRLMTDETGRYHPNGIPPALIRSAVRKEMVELAARVLAPQFAAAIERSRLIFFQPIVDLESPQLVFGRVALIGDAAFVARPHVAMGVPKGAGDALALVRALRTAGADRVSALAQFERERLRVSSAIVARGKYLGAYMEAQTSSEAERLRAEKLRVPETVMMETAAYVDYDRVQQ